MEVTKMSKNTWTYNKIFKWAFRIISLCFTIICIVLNKNGEYSIHVTSGFLMVISSFGPDLLAAVLKLNLSNALDFFIQFFIMLALVLGRLLNLYSILPWWDLFLHLLSGVLIGIIALAQLHLVVGDETFKKLPPFFVWLFVTLASIAGAALWEFWEFAGDQLLGFDSQLNSLVDTMTDMIMGTISGLLIASASYINVRFNKFKFLNGFINGFIRKK